MKIVALYVTLLLTIASQQVTSFWFTDTSLFQQPTTQVQESVQPQQASPDEAKTSTTENPVRSKDEKGATQATAPWYRVGEQPSECSCNLDWIQNQTSSWLNKWLHSTDGLSQMRLLLSNSTGARSNINRRNNNNEATRQRAGHDQASSTVNHWAPRDQQKGNNEQHQASDSAKRHLLPNAQGRHSRANGQQQHSSGKLTQGPRGPPGPKGETGPKGERGERGESGGPSLVKVKDRDALFDLANQQQANSSNNNNLSLLLLSSGQLVFVEAEQMLVIRTDFGWRPVQLLPALFNFRKTIAKFSLTSEEQRRRLISGESDNFIQSSIARHANRQDDRPGTVLKTGKKAGQPGRSGRNDINAEEFMIDDGEDDDDDDDDDDDEDENDRDDAIDYDDDRHGDDGEEDDDEDDDNFEDADDNRISSSFDLTKRKLSASKVDRAKLDVTETVTQVTLPKRSLVAARSAATSALVSPPIKAETQMKLADESPSQTGDGGQMKVGAHVGKTLVEIDTNANQNAQLHTYTLKLRLVALNEPFSGNIHGVRGADFECKRNAAKANIKGSFRAFIASGFQNLNEVVRQNVHKHPVINMRGEILANSWHDLLKRPTRFGNPLSRIYSFDGRHVATDSRWPNKLVWHGSSSRLGHRDSSHNCDGWHTESLTKFGNATPLHTPRTNRRRQHKRHLTADATNHGNHTNQTETGLLLDIFDKYPCRMPLVVLCIETIGQQSQPPKSKIDDNDDVETNLV